MAKHLGVNRVTVYRFETYRRRPDDANLQLIADLPNFPLSVADLRADYDANYSRSPQRKSEVKAA